MQELKEKNQNMNEDELFKHTVAPAKNKFESSLINAL